MPRPSYYVGRFLSNMVGLKELYLVIHRDPFCQYGPPRQWETFKRSALDRHNFLPFSEFIGHHPQDPAVKCKYEKNSERALVFENRVKENLGNRATTIKIAIVAGPY
ncbi:hypothetical protein F5Y19DRAFT_407702 [Xylariaceae sp. FL1651]|nr:hypothetical protein F5Y19DRAFT_407702 [Xylariaceae sp. FL1651]